MCVFSSTEVHLELFATMCYTEQDSCFHSTEKAAEYIAYAMSVGTEQTVPIYKIDARGHEDCTDCGPEPPTTGNLTLVLVCAASFFIIVALLIGVLVQVVRRKQKRAHASSTWYPEGWVPQANTQQQQQGAAAAAGGRRGPDGEEEVET